MFWALSLGFIIALIKKSCRAVVYERLTDVITDNPAALDIIFRISAFM